MNTFSIFLSFVCKTINATKSYFLFVCGQYNPSGGSGDSDTGRKGTRFSARARPARRSTRRRKSSDSEEEETPATSDDDYSDVSRII